MFVFSCQQFCLCSVCCRLLVLCLWRSRPFRLLSSSEDQAEHRLAISWLKGRNTWLPNSQRFLPLTKIVSLLVPACYQLLRKREVPMLGKSSVETAGSSSTISWFRELCVVNCCREVRNRPMVELFLPSHSVWWRRSCPLQLFDMLLDGLLEKRWVRGAELEDCKSEYQSFVQKQRQPERTSTSGRPDVGNVFTLCSPKAGFRAQRHLYKVCIISINVGFSLTATSGSFMFCFRSFN